MYTFRQQKKSATVIPFAILVGAAMGSAIGILFAPRKGSESRKRMKDKAADLKRIFINDEMDPLNERQSLAEGSLGIQNQKAGVKTMHAVTGADSNDATPSKAAAMVSHLKHTKQENNHTAEPQ